MEVELRIVKGPTRIKSIKLRTDDAIIGRGRGCKIRIPSAQVSRRHCLLFVEDNFLWVEDLESANGTFVNGVRIKGRKKIRPGDQLSVGPLTVAAEYEAPVEDIDPLELLANAEADVVECELLDDVEVVGDDIPEVELLSEEVFPDKPTNRAVEDGDDAIPIELDDQWELPDPNELRDILSDLDDAESNKS